jgi:hypothetical protein
MYGVYAGGLVFRADLPCLHNGKPDCLGCRRTAVSVISAYQLDPVWSPMDTARRRCSTNRSRSRTWSTHSGRLESSGT